MDIVHHDSQGEDEVGGWPRTFSPDSQPLGLHGKGGSCVGRRDPFSSRLVQGK